MLLFIWARPTPRFSRPAHAHFSGPTIETEARCGRTAVGMPPAGRSQAPRRPCAAWRPRRRTPPPPLCCPPPPLRKEPPAAGRFSSPPRVVHLARPSPSATHASPTAQASASPAFHHRSPSSAPDSIRASPPSTPFR
jgi:hypothetical protein